MLLALWWCMFRLNSSYFLQTSFSSCSSSEISCMCLQLWRYYFSLLFCLLSQHTLTSGTVRGYKAIVLYRDAFLLLCWHVNFRIITCSALWRDYFGLLGFVSGLLLPSPGCFLVKPCFGSSYFLLLVEQLPVRPLVVSSSFWLCHVSPGGSCYTAVTWTYMPPPVLSLSYL